MAGNDFDGLLFLRGIELIQPHDIASGVVVAIGDLVKTSGGTCLRVAANTDDLVLWGIAKEAHGATDPAAKISIAMANGQAVYLANLDAATALNQGDLLQMYSGAVYTKLKKSTTDPVAMAVQKVGSAALTVEVVLLAPATTGAVRLIRDAS